MANNEYGKVVRFNQTGDSSVLQIEKEKLTSPQHGEVRIKVAAIGLNRAEVMFRKGVYLEQPEFPAKLGYEASGAIDAIGDGVNEYQVGDLVSTIPAFSMGVHGVYGEYAVVPAAAVAKYPDKLSSIEATSIWMQYVTAWGALCEIGNLKEGQSVVITAASSSVGIAAIQMAKMKDAKVIATTRGAKKVQALLDAGADHVIQTNCESIPVKVNEWTQNKGADLIFDPIGGPGLIELGAAAGQGAKIIEYGALDGRKSLFPLIDALGKGLAVVGYTLFEITRQPEKLRCAKSFIFEGLLSGQLKPIIDRTFSFDEVRQAHEYMESNEQIGKIVMCV